MCEWVNTKGLQMAAKNSKQKTTTPETHHVPTSKRGGGGVESMHTCKRMPRLSRLDCVNRRQNTFFACSQKEDREDEERAELNKEPALEVDCKTRNTHMQTEANTAQAHS